VATSSPAIVTSPSRRKWHPGDPDSRAPPIAVG